jgi:nucleoside-diphosphate-sugar epimerase
MSSNKPNVLILGGVGFVGRNLVTYLVERSMCQTIRVVDKVLPATAYLTERQQEAFAQVDYRQGNLASSGNSCDHQRSQSLDFVSLRGKDVPGPGRIFG